MNSQEHTLGCHSPCISKLAFVPPGTWLPNLLRVQLLLLSRLLGRHWSICKPRLKPRRSRLLNIDQLIVITNQDQPSQMPAMKRASYQIRPSLDTWVHRDRLKSRTLISIIPDPILIIALWKYIGHLTADVVLIYNIDHGGATTRVDDLPIRGLGIEDSLEAALDAVNVDVGVVALGLDAVEDELVLRQVLVAEVPVDLCKKSVWALSKSRSECVPCHESARPVDEAHASC